MQTSPVESHRTIGELRVPSFMYGTAWKEDDTERLTQMALDSGFRAIDTANQRRHYYEAGVGAALARAISAGQVAREELFLQTKFTQPRGQDHRIPYDVDADARTQVRDSFASSLEHLGVDHIDSYVLHGPSQRQGLSDYDWQIWRAMEEIADEGRTSLLGISNVAPGQLETLCEGARIRPTFVQNRCYARMGWDRQVRAVCDDRGIVYQGFSLLTANPEIFRSPAFRRIVTRVDKTPAQVVFRFSLQLGMLPLTGTSSGEHMREDLDIYDFELTAEDIEVITAISLR